MTNNDVLRRIRYTFDLKDTKLVKIFELGSLSVTLEQVKNWLKKDDDAEFIAINDFELASFLNGFIVEKRGKKEGVEVKAEQTLTKNLVLMKLKIALSLQNDDIIQLLASTGFKVGASELSAFFRKPTHKNYRHCKSQFLRNVLQALQDKYRPQKPSPVGQKHAHSGQKPSKPKTISPKEIYINPNATPKIKTSERGVLKLKGNKTK